GPASSDEGATPPLARDLITVARGRLPIAPARPAVALTAQRRPRDASSLRPSRPSPVPTGLRSAAKPVPSLRSRSPSEAQRELLGPDHPAPAGDDVEAMGNAVVEDLHGEAAK